MDKMEETPIRTVEEPKVYTSTPNPTLKIILNTNSMTPSVTPAVETQEMPVEIVPLPQVDKSYINNTIKPSLIVFDDEFMYYIDGCKIIKRNIETNAASIIFEGVYDNQYLSIQDGWLYLYTRGKGIIKVKCDGKMMEVIRNVQAEKVMVIENNLYYYSVQDPFWDWPYALYELNLITNENKLLIRAGTDAKYINETFYFTSYDGLVDHLETYNTLNKELKSTGVTSFGVPIIIKGIAYHFFEDLGFDNRAFYIENIKTNKKRIIEIDGNNLTQYYNYLLYIDTEYQLNAFDVESEQIYFLMPFDNKKIVNVHGEELFVNLETNSEDNTLYAINLSKEAELEKLCDIDTNYVYDNVGKAMQKLSEIKINNEWVALPHSVFSFEYGRDRIDSIIYKDKEYSLKYEESEDDVYRHNIYVADGENERIVVENCAVVEDLPSFAIINDTIFYHVDENPGSLYTYNLISGKTNNYETGMGLTIRFFPYYQYLVMDSYYKEYHYSFFNENDLNAEELNPIFSIAYNLETGEIIEVVNDISGR